MISFHCKKCGKHLGELKKGRLKKGTHLICAECYKIIETQETAQKFSNLTGSCADSNNYPDIFNELFKNKKG